MTPVSSKSKILLNATVATDATNSAMVDRLGFDYAVFDVVMRPATGTNSSAKWTVLKLMQADTTAVSDAANISGYIGTTNSTAAGGTAAEFVIPANNTTTAGGTTAADGGGQVTRLMVPLQGKKRYLFLISQANASHQTALAMVHLYRGKEVPDSAADANVAALVGH